jgi:CheY-like chemotaxis protein
MTGAVQLRPWPTRLAAASAALLVALGLTVLIGWVSHTFALIQLHPQLAPMTRNTGACFLLCGLALLLVTLNSPRWPVVACAGIVSALSVLTLVEYVFSVNAGTDALLGPSYIAVELASPGRMAPAAATCFGLVPIGLLLAPKILSQRYALLFGVNGSVIAAIGIATSMTFALGSSAAFGWGHVTRAPPLTALGLLVLGIGMLALAWHVETPLDGTPRWLPISAGVVVATGTVGLWQALIADGYAPFALLPATVLVGGWVMAPIFELTVYLAQRAHAQAMALRRSQAGRLQAAPNSIPGASFSFTIPRASESGTGPHSPGVIRTPAVTDAESRGDNSVMVVRSLVSVVDDDESVRESLPDLLRELGYAVQAFGSAAAFLASPYMDQTKCLILDIAMPDMSGPDLQRELKRRRYNIPIVFITAYRDETVRQRALEQGAVECLFKPFSEQDLVEALKAALE